MYTGAGETGGVYADEVQAQDGQMKSIRKKDTIGQVTSRSRTHAGAMPNEGVQKGGDRVCVVGGKGVLTSWRDLKRQAKETAVGLTWYWVELMTSKMTSWKYF